MCRTPKSSSYYQTKTSCILYTNPTQAQLTIDNRYQGFYLTTFRSLLRFVQQINFSAGNKWGIGIELICCKLICCAYLWRYIHLSISTERNIPKLGVNVKSCNKSNGYPMLIQARIRPFIETNNRCQKQP